MSLFQTTQGVVRVQWHGARVLASTEDGRRTAETVGDPDDPVARDVAERIVIQALEERLEREHGQAGGGPPDAV